MKNLARFTIAFVAAQLLFVGFASAAVCSHSTEDKSTVSAMPLGDPGEEPGPFETF